MCRFLTSLLVVLSTACGGSATEPAVGPVRADLEAAPAAVTLAGQSVSVEPYLWRDFASISPPDGRPLVASVRLRAAGGVPLAADVTADSVWVISGPEAWAARAVQEQPRSATGAYLEVVARNGPKWGPGMRVDVVVRARDGAGRVVYVRAADQPIARTD